MISLLAAIVLNLDVRQETIHTTICVAGYSDEYRRSHPVHVKPRKGYVRDHRVPIVLGGASDPANIQYQTVAEARIKNREEKALSRAVCAGRMGLEAAQLEMAGRWP